MLSYKLSRCHRVFGYSDALFSFISAAFVIKLNTFYLSLFRLGNVTTVFSALGAVSVHLQDLLLVRYYSIRQSWFSLNRNLYRAISLSRTISRLFSKSLVFIYVFVDIVCLIYYFFPNMWCIFYVYITVTDVKNSNEINSKQ